MTPNLDELAEITPMGEFFHTTLTTKFIVFGNLTAIEYAEKHGWEAVWATISRVYSPIKIDKEGYETKLR